jgi:hypothetical protein
MKVSKKWNEIFYCSVGVKIKENIYKTFSSPTWLSGDVEEVS